MDCDYENSNNFKSIVNQISNLQFKRNITILLNRLSETLLEIEIHDFDNDNEDLRLSNNFTTLSNDKSEIQEYELNDLFGNLLKVITGSIIVEDEVITPS
jgi:hypothetical protein